MSKIKSIKRINILLLIILIIAAVVRYWGINYGLPNVACQPGEKEIVGIISSPVRFFHPGTFYYPSLYKYILLCFYAFYFLFGLIIGKYTSIMHFVKDFSINPTNFYLINRFISAFFGTATIFIVYKIAKDLFNKKIALLSSLFLSLAYLHVRDSHFGATDIPMTFFIMWSLLFIERRYKNKTVKNYTIAGILTGLATSTKYPAILLTVPMFIVHSFNILENKDKKVKLCFDKRIIFFIIALACSFLIGSPFVLLDFTKFTNDFLTAIGFVNRGMSIMLGRGWWYHLRFSLFYGLGWSLLFASLAGMFFLIKTDTKKAMILYSFPLIYYIPFGKAYAVLSRYAIPFIPFLCIAGSVFTIYIGDNLIKLARHAKLRLKNIIIFLIAILVISPSTYNIIQFNKLLAKKDNRLIATEWVSKNLSKCSSIYQTGSIWGRLQLYISLESLEKKYKKAIEDGDGGRVLKSRIDYRKKKNIIGYEHWTYDDSKEAFKFEDREIDDLPKYIIVQESPLVLYSKISPKIKELLRTSYYLKKSFKVIDIATKENLFDQSDAFYVPFVGFKNVQRPGPNIYIYEEK